MRRRFPFLGLLQRSSGNFSAHWRIYTSPSIWEVSSFSGARGEAPQPCKGVMPSNEDFQFGRRGMWTLLSPPGLSERGRSRFDRSRPSVGGCLLYDGEEGLAGEAMTGNGTTTLILRVDASKATHRREPKNRQNLQKAFRRGRGDRAEDGPRGERKRGHGRQTAGER